MMSLAIIAAVLATLLPAELSGQVLRIDRQSQWQTWSFPRGAVELREDGGLRLGRFDRQTDPLQDAAAFEHPTRQRGTVTGGVAARSRAGDAFLLMDRDPGTWWQPDPADGLDDWVVEVDLGRVVLLEKVRLVFPDTLGAGPFRDFSIYVSEGSTLSATADLFRFTRVGTTTRPNYDRVVEYALFTQDSGNLAIGESLVTDQTLPYMPVQYLRFVPHQPTPDAALAELELVAVGDDIGLGTFARGGGVRAGEKFASKAPGLFDGTVDGYWNASAAREAEAYWRDGGQWFEWDLGAVFWLDQIVLYSWDAVALGFSSFLAGSGMLGYELSVSEGQQIAFAGGKEDRIMGNYNYELLSAVNNTATPRRWIFDHRFARRKVRYLFYHHDLGTGRYGFNIFETFLFGQGYPAQVELVSDLIDLGSPKGFTGLSWEADLPPGTALEVRTRTGDQLDVEIHYYHKNGSELSKEQWEKLPRVVQGPTEEVVREGADWSGWSEAYVTPGEPFRSPSPRRYARLKLILSTDDPETSPLLRSLSLFYQEPLVRGGVTAEVFPREARIGVREAFSYRIRPDFSTGDQGFDSVLIPLPSEADGLAAWVGGREVSGASFTMAGDTLRVVLPQTVRRDSVEIRFTARTVTNPTFFDALLLHSAAPGRQQEVKPAHRDALKVFLPEVAAQDEIIANLELAPEVLTPNGDGINDQAVLSFDLLKVDLAPVVEIYDLGGRMIRALSGQTGAGQRYAWDGLKDDGERAAPGTYIWRIEVQAEIGKRTAHRLVCVAY